MLDPVENKSEFISEIMIAYVNFIFNIALTGKINLVDLAGSENNKVDKFLVDSIPA